MRTKIGKHIFLMILGLCIIITSGYFLDADHGYVEHYEENLIGKWINTGGDVPIAIPTGGLAVGGLLYVFNLYRLLDTATWKVKK